MSSEKIEKTDEEWRESLSDEQFRVTRQAGTEAPFSGKYNVHEEAGKYTCICCNAVLFEDNHKFNSGCGWPSFWGAESEAVGTRPDNSHGMVRTEIFCVKCDAHLGHVFDDGPKPGGLRYCVNSVSINFEADDDKA
ncbi:MAG: peptide-methionine (R)-S-oxide reductase MsrB [Deltaproteobacteria bacterium]|jgi:peptide-methionine (R)-S-oxide reductase|nr:peptide-methionine (R)-S-oxide reductase MsrB [Deltaproteobacteria bacterium]MBT6431946.1 peptide-methionine (R)-S-oxide reductase MsrB [Deltaproteobacteria bacterium]MBT6491348.1 peptide-methionine (R)-S-oxide reductase MsrB [Deltaproteobacteria bacterium]